MRKWANGKCTHNPYSLSENTNEAREVLKLALNENIAREDEEIVKSYLLNKKICGEI